MGTLGARPATDVPLTTVEAVAEALRQDPVIVQQVMGNGHTAEAVAALQERAADLGVPVYIALTGRVDGLPARDTSDEFVRLLHARVGEPGLYIGAADSSLSWNVYDVDLDQDAMSSEVSEAREELAALQGGDCCSSGLSEAGEAVLLLAAPAPGRLSTDDIEAIRDQPGLGTLSTAYAEWDSWEPPDPWPETGLSIGFALFAALTTYAVIRNWRPRTLKATATSKTLTAVRHSTSEREDPSAVFQRRAARTVARLTREIDKGRADESRLEAAREARDEAERLAESIEPVELFGADTLARTGLAVLKGTAPYRCCFFHPLHGDARTTAVLSGLSVPCCEACARSVESGRDPDALENRRGLLAKPYWEFDSVWARTGFGSLVDDYAAQVRDARTAR